VQVSPRLLMTLVVCLGASGCRQVGLFCGQQDGAKCVQDYECGVGQVCHVDINACHDNVCGPPDGGTSSEGEEGGE
jgi:hypothetical protein